MVWLKTFLKDTLTEWSVKQKRYAVSMRRIAIAVSFPYALSIGCNIVYGNNQNPLSIQVFQTIFLFVTVGLGYNLYANINKSKEE